eukprot:1074070-Amphidinium_carterae.1
MEPTMRLSQEAWSAHRQASLPTSSQRSRVAMAWTYGQHQRSARIFASCLGCGASLASVMRRLGLSTSTVRRKAIKNLSRSWPQKDVPVAWAWAGAKPGTARRRRVGSSTSCERVSDIVGMYDAFTFDFDELLQVAHEDDVLECLLKLCQSGRKVVLISEYPGRAA